MSRRLPAADGVLDIPGFAIGHGSDPQLRTGVTVVLCPEGAAGAAEVRGSATGTRQFDSLVHPGHIGSRCHALVFSGGSGYGLAAADPVVDSLRTAGKGFDTGVGVVPLVPTAILFDLAAVEPVRRDYAALARVALEEASAGPVATGSVGAGTGATVGKALGLECAMAGGIGFRSLDMPDGLAVAALVAVNAFGDVRDPAGGEILAGCRTAPDSRELAGADRVLAARGPDDLSAWEGNTTLAVVLTNAACDRGALRKVCEMAFGGLYRALVPALTLYDGDLVVALARGDHPAHLHQVAVLAEQLVAEAIVDAVESAEGAPGLPSRRDLLAVN